MSKKKEKKNKKKNREVASQQVVTSMPSNETQVGASQPLPTDSYQTREQATDQLPHDLVNDLYNVAKSPEGRLLGDATKKGLKWAYEQQQKEDQKIEIGFEKSRRAVLRSNMSEEDKSYVMRHLEEAESTSKEKNNNKWGKIITGGCALVIGAICYLLGRQIGSEKQQMNLMTMDDLIKKVHVQSELEHHYFEVLRAIGEMKDLKDEEKELWKQLQLLKKIFEVLIFKGNYGVKLGTGANAFKKLLNEIKCDPNGTSRWMKGLEGKEKEKLYHQVREICEYLDGYKNITER